MKKRNESWVQHLTITLCLLLITCNFFSCKLFSSSDKDLSNEDTACYTCTNTLYCGPYLIFQASLSTKPSDFYLTAFDVSSGEIIRINKGYHRRFFIRHGKLYFRQCDCFYTCDVGSFNSREEIDKAVFFEELASEKGHLEYVEECKEIPEEFKTIDTYFINQVVRGNITNTVEEDMIFLTGDEKNSSIGIIREKNGFFVPTLTSALFFPDNEPYPFWQAIVTNIDADPLDEIIMIGHFHNHNHNPTIVYIWEYDETLNKLISQTVTSFTRVSNPEMVSLNNGVFLRYTYKNKLFKYKLTRDHVTHNYSLEPTNEEVTPILFSHTPGPYFPRFSFLETFENSKALSFAPNTCCSTFPYVTLPDSLSINPVLASEKEKSYVAKYNSYLSEFTQLLENGIDPFDQKIPGEEELEKSPAVLLTEKLDPTDSHFIWDSKGFIHHVDVFFPIVLKNKEYIFVHAKDNYPNRYTFLFDSNWKLLEFTSYEGIDIDIKVIYSLEKPSYFWIGTWNMFGPYYLKYSHIQDGKLIQYKDCCTPSFYRKNEKVYFEYAHEYIFIETKNSDSYMQASRYVNPFTHETNYTDFKEEMLDQYDSLYMYYFCLRYKYASFDSLEYLDCYCFSEPDYCIELKENQKKINSWFYPGKVLEEYEETLHEQGWE